MKILQITDIHMNKLFELTNQVNVTDNFSAILESGMEYRPDLVVLTGDLGHNDLQINVYQWIKEHCKDCKECVKNCPEDALIEKQDHVILDSDKCIGSKQGCGECIKSCPIYNKGYIETLKEYKKGII